jgi:hypothetical protein
VESVRIFIPPAASTGYLVSVGLPNFEGTFICNPRSGRVGRVIGLEHAPKLNNNLRLRCGLNLEAVGGSNWW